MKGVYPRAFWGKKNGDNIRTGKYRRRSRHNIGWDVEIDKAVQELFLEIDWFLHS